MASRLAASTRGGRVAGAKPPSPSTTPRCTATSISPFATRSSGERSEVTPARADRAVTASTLRTYPRLRLHLLGGVALMWPVIERKIGDLSEVLDNLGVFRSSPEELVAMGPSGFRRVPIAQGPGYYLSLQGFGADQVAFAHTHPDSEEWVIVLKGC